MKKMRCLSCALALTFLLGVSDGYIALWQDGKTDPVRVFPYLAENLPAADQQALKNGIRLEDESALIRLLEDYLS